MLKSRRFLIVFCASLMVSFVTTPATYSQETPALAPLSDPQSLMLEASKLNNLTLGDLQPWHLKATFTVLDDQGKTTDQGTFEEFWAGPTKDKQVYSTPTFSQTDYRTPDGLFRSATTGFPPSIAVDARREFISPMPTPADVAHQTYELENRDAGPTKLSCLKISGLPANPGLSYCLARDEPFLRLNILGFASLQVLHNRILSFNGHYIAGDLDFIRSSKHIGTAHLETLESLGPIDEALFAPSPDAKLVPRRIQISAGVAVGLLESRKAPAYPPSALAARISGTVVLETLIDVDGAIKELHVIQGPPELQQAALDAVRTWRYRPYILNGEPVEVRTTINVVFTLNH